MKTYALLIGINQYHPDSKVASLSGCENDVKYMKHFLEERFPKKHLFIETLLNEEASYEKIIDHFGQTHLLKAEKGDRVLVHYSGHGAREKAANEFKLYFPEEKQETLVCYDSRLPGHYDLADKELGVLIEHIARKGVQVILILDCCHSGSGTRDINGSQLGKARQWDDRKTERPLDTYLNGHFKNKIYAPNSKHILLASCEKREKSYELTSHRGNFTTHLLKVLNQSKGNISFADLFAQTRILMRKISDKQTPQFETYGFFNAHANFLDSGFHKNTLSYQVFFQQEQWMIEAGAVQGIATTPDDKAVFEIYDDQLLLGYAETTSVHLNTSSININASLDPKKNYTAQLISIPVPPIAVELKVKQSLKKKLKNIFLLFNPIYFELVEDVPFALYQLLVLEGQIKIIRSSDQLSLRAFSNTEADDFKDVFAFLEHLCRWEKTLALKNAQMPNRQDVELFLIELDIHRKVIRETNNTEIIIEILKQNQQEKKVPFRLEVRNQSKESWNCALFYLSGNYGVYSMYNEEVPALNTAIMAEYDSNGKPFSFELNGKNEATDIFKLIVSKEKINDYLLTQSPIKIGESIGKSRAIGIEEEEKFQQESFNDWFSITMRCKSIIG